MQFEIDINSNAKIRIEKSTASVDIFLELLLFISSLLSWYRSDSSVTVDLCFGSGWLSFHPLDSYLLFEKKLKSVQLLTDVYS